MRIVDLFYFSLWCWHSRKCWRMLLSFTCQSLARKCVHVLCCPINFRRTCVCVRACVHVCVCECVWECMCMWECMCTWEWERVLQGVRDYSVQLLNWVKRWGAYWPFFCFKLCVCIIAHIPLPQDMCEDMCVHTVQQHPHSTTHAHTHTHHKQHTHRVNKEKWH